jgi:methionyl-tRNA formyltransferase
VRVTLLTGHVDSPHACDILKALNDRGMRGVHVIAATGTSPRRSLAALWNAHGPALPQAAWQWVWRKGSRSLRGSIATRPATVPLSERTQAQGGRFIVVRDANGDECQRHLRELAVDLQVLAGAPIMRAPVLAIPRLGTLNAHMGILPRYRGMNTVEWAVLEGSMPGVTVHFVDAGVDTGDIIATQSVPLHPGDTLDVVRARANQCQIDLLSRTVAAACVGPLPRQPQRREDGRQYYTMHPRLRVVAEARLANALHSLEPATV